MVLTMVPREVWGAAEPRGPMPELEAPVPLVLLRYHAVCDAGCHTGAECRQDLRDTQTYEQNFQEWPDIQYNFYIGGDGRVYEGRGWDAQPINEFPEEEGRYLYIAYIGEWDSATEPPALMKDAFYDWLEYGLSSDYISRSFKLEHLRLLSPWESRRLVQRRNDTGKITIKDKTVKKPTDKGFKKKKKRSIRFKNKVYGRKHKPKSYSEQKN